ncbi:hypothetical protein ScPMuIL_018228 [Solemya velum]
MARQELLMLFVSIAVVLFGSVCGRIPNMLRGRPKGGMLGAPANPGNINLPPDMWFTQKLDHFNEADTRTWQQKYSLNDTFHTPGGPVFIMLGGEGPANAIWLVEGAWITYAAKFGAFCLQLEHRYYGKSHPTPDMSTKNLEYLSSEQALMDAAVFIQYVKMKFNLTDNKFVTFGGSYSGSLSGWFREKYPHLVDGAVATSAPVFAKVNFLEYLGVVRDSLGTTGSTCNQNIAVAIVKFSNMMAIPAKRGMLEKLFRLCDPIDHYNAPDVANLYSTLAGNFEGIVQYNKDNRAFEGAVDTKVTIDTLCEIMSNESLGCEVHRYAAVNSLLLDTYSQKCLDYKYSSMINDLKKTDWNSTAAEGGRQWMYQTCVEFGWYQSSDLSDQPFGQHFPLSFSVQQCADIFGSKFTKSFIQDSVEKTNTNYGGYGLKVTNVVFPNGSIDPWHKMGITKNLSSLAPAVFINGTAHCANMYPPSPNDSEQLVQARTFIMGQISDWIKK